MSFTFYSANIISLINKQLTTEIILFLIFILFKISKIRSRLSLRSAWINVDVFVA